MYSNNMVNFQESTAMLNACTKQVWKLIEYITYAIKPDQNQPNQTIVRSAFVIVIKFLVLCSICLFPLSLLRIDPSILRGWMLHKDAGCASVYSFNEISVKELGFQKFSRSSKVLFLFLSSLLIWWGHLRIFRSTCNFPSLQEFWFLIWQFHSWRFLSFSTFHYEYGTFHSKISWWYIYCFYQSLHFFSFSANNLIFSMYIGADFVNLYPLELFLSMQFSGIILIIIITDESSSPWKIPVWIFTSAKNFSSYY